MRKLFYIFKKEWLLLVRDVPGLIILFLMPVLLIFVVTLAQENALSGQHNPTEILYADGMNNAFSTHLRSTLDSSGIFKPVTTINGKPVSQPEAHILVRSGKYRIAVLLIHPDSAIILLTDPTLQEAYKSNLLNPLTFIIRGLQNRETMQGIIGNLPPSIKPVITGMVDSELAKLPPVREVYAQRDKATIEPNVIQNNVPGFILFAMYFIVIPLAGSLITERNEGSFQRLRSLPVHPVFILGGKVIMYTIVCLVQFFLMMAVGIWVFPAFFGFPALEIGTQYTALAVATLSASLSAIGFGILTGSAATSHNQAALFGSVMVVLLGIISGTFLPVHILPAPIRLISHLSPVRWGIDNYLNLLVREGSLSSILPNTILQLLFFGLAMIASIAIFARNK